MVVESAVPVTEAIKSFLPETSNISITWESVRNADYWTLLQNY